VKCRRCRGPAVIDLRAQHAAYCGDCFLHHCREQVRRTVSKYRMIRRADRPLIAISGGKDSLALWDILTELEYQVDGVYLGLGIGQYSDRSGEAAREFAAARGLKLLEVDLAADVGFGIPDTAATGRSPCSACGLSKRHLLNTTALEHGYNVLVTGHNLDDEVAVLFGNTMRFDMPYLARQHPVLPEREGFARRVKPLVKLTERETAAYCVIRRIDYLIEECPMAAGNKHLAYKDVLNTMEDRAPGTKAQFFTTFQDNLLPLLADLAEEERGAVHPCARCGSPTVAEVCAFCRLRDRASVTRERRLTRRESVNRAEKGT
jgi:uncharacterized protein (TIGR00269 family)